MSTPPADDAPPRAVIEASARVRASAPASASVSASASASAFASASASVPTQAPTSTQVSTPTVAPTPAPAPTSGAGAATAAPPPPPPPATVQGFWRHGRYYGNWRPNKYLVPIDSEELSRLDLLHKFFSLSGKAQLCNYPLEDNMGARVLDLGTGTGIWAVAMIQKNLDLDMTAVDLNRIQPHMIPEGLHFLQYDLEEPSWTPRVPLNQNLVHIRQLFGSVRSDLWPQLYSNAFKHALPGDGYFEQVEIDYTPRFATHELPPQSAIIEWSDRYLQGMDRAGRSVRVDPERTRRQLAQAGFVDIREETIRCCLSPWSEDKDEADASRWFNFGVTNGLQALALIPMIDHGDLRIEQVQDLCRRAEHEVCHLKYRIYMTMYTWTARRPVEVRGPRQLDRALPVPPPSTSSTSAPHGAPMTSRPSYTAETKGKAM